MKTIKIYVYFVSLYKNYDIIWYYFLYDILEFLVDIFILVKYYILKIDIVNI